MKLAIICAMDEELAEIWSAIPMNLIGKLEKASNLYWEYQMGEHTLIAVVCGIGKVNAAIATQILVDNFAVDAVVNVGVAGSLSPELTFGDVVIASDLVEHDFDTTVFGDRFGQIPRLDTFSFACDDGLYQKLTRNLHLEGNKVTTGRIVSGDQFVDNPERAQFLQREFGALACEMEGAAVAHVCYLNQIPFAVVRSLSDMAGLGSAGAHSYHELKYMAAQRAALVVKNLIGNL